MLFTTAEFAFIYLPIVAIGFFMLGRRPRAAAAWLGLASVFFYGWWMPVYVVLLLVSIVANYIVGVFIGRIRDRSDGGKSKARAVLILGLAFNLGLLSWFKYANFLIDALRTVSGLSLPEVDVVLPIGISFFTFTQIAFLVDTYKEGTREYRFIHYLLFVTYFPHLVAGPILHHAQMMPQFDDDSIYSPNTASIAAGFSMFAMGLAKKVIIADSIAPYADSLFDAVAAGVIPTMPEAWIGALGYTLQLYFDFSGYSDMAVGLSMILGIRLPYNFASPYRATNISEFWRRWHMTLSAFLRDYLYIPLGGNRLGPGRRRFNLMVTMLLGGLWHGANWTFVAWGGLHGLYLAVHHSLAPIWKRPVVSPPLPYLMNIGGWFITMSAVVIAWVFFRAADFDTAGAILSAMFDSSSQSGIPKIMINAGLSVDRAIALIVSYSAIALFPWNSNAIFEWILGVCRKSSTLAWIGIGAATSFVVALILVSELRSTTSPFIYFNF